MRIEPNQVNQGALPAGQSPRSPDAGAKPQGASDLAPAVSTYIPAAEWKLLVEKVRQEPEVRLDVLNLVAERLARGEYANQDAAERTAALLAPASQAWASGPLDQ